MLYFVEAKANRIKLLEIIITKISWISWISGNGQERTSSRVTGPPRYACQNFKMAEYDTRAA